MNNKKIKYITPIKSYIDKDGSWMASFKEEDFIKLFGKKFVKKIPKL